MLNLILFLVVLVSIFFWMTQVIDLLFLEVSRLESHQHKLIWFLVVFLGSVVGALWFFTWNRRPADSVEMKG